MSLRVETENNANYVANTNNDNKKKTKKKVTVPIIEQTKEEKTQINYLKDMV